MAAAAYLGGHLSFAEGIGVDQTAFEDGAASDWIAVLGGDDLAEGEQALRDGRRHGGDARARSGGELYALSDHCSHRGGPLHEGELGDGTITCPLARQRVRRCATARSSTGRPPIPQPAWGARVRAAASRSAAGKYRSGPWSSSCARRRIAAR